MNITEQIETLVAEELKQANEKFPPFNSPHEGYAVLLEEVEELQEDIRQIEIALRNAWLSIRANCSPDVNIKAIKNCAVAAAYEAIQVSAMAQKFLEVQ